MAPEVLDEITDRLERLEGAKFEVEVISPTGERSTGRVSVLGGQLILDLSNM